jgi:nucleoside-diphosphate kinase
MKKIANTTFSYIKPDAISNWEIIYDMIKNSGFEIIASKVYCFKKEEAEELYQEHAKKSFFQELVEFTCSKGTIMLVLKKENAVSKFRELIGETNPANARGNTIRKLFGTPNGGHLNAIHGSDCDESAKREIKMFFPELSYLWE